MPNQQKKTVNKGSGLGYHGRGYRSNTNNAEAIAALQASLPQELKLVDHHVAPSRCSGHCILIWNNPAYGELALAEYVSVKEIHKILDELPKWKYVAQAVAITYEQWQKDQYLPSGSMVYWKYSYSNTFQYRDTKVIDLWRCEERVGNDWRFVSALELPDFRGATSCDRKYYLPSGEEVVRTDWNKSTAWAIATKRWELEK